MVSTVRLRLNGASKLTQPLFGRWWENVIWKESSEGLAKAINRVDSTCHAKLDRIGKVAVVRR
jgi:hypothetical protein